MNMERCKAPDPRPSTPDPLAQLEAMLREHGGFIEIERGVAHYYIRFDDGDWFDAPTLAAAIAALAEKVGGGE